MKRIILLVAALGLVGAACSGTNVEESFEELSEGAPSEVSAPATPSVDAPTSDVASSDDLVSDEAPIVEPEGPLAPDFTLALEPSGEFVLSQEVKPVYMVFWAEW
jgi:hypothetical protein